MHWARALCAVALAASLAACATAAVPRAPASPAASESETVASSSFASPFSSPPPLPTPDPPPPPLPTPEPPAPPPEPPPPPPTDPLIGGPLLPAPVIAVKIDNTAQGFPQYGVSAADIVYVEQVEGGLTRLLAVFHSNLPGEVGAVRSLRSTDAELLPMFGTPALVFSGGAGGPLAALAATPVIDAGGVASWRSRNARAPFNVHSDVAAVAAELGSLQPPKDIGFAFADGDPRWDAAPAFGFVSARYPAARAEFAFDGARYSVLRGGAALADAQGNAVTADNVLIQFVHAVPDGTVDSVGNPSHISHTVGSGPFRLFRDGKGLDGTWSRPAADEPTQYVDAAGVSVPFKPGKTWVVLATPSTTVTAS